MSEGTFSERGSALLNEIWNELSADAPGNVPPQLSNMIDAVFNGTEIGYKKAIIIQAAGKAADVTLDAQAMQKGAGTSGSWDAREFAKKTFVPWNQSIGEPFSHTGDPYVSNPYRVPRFDEAQREQRKKKSEFDATLAVLRYLNTAETNDAARFNLKAVLAGLQRAVAGQSVDYPLPNRVSLPSVIGAIDEFLRARSGGARLQAVVQALFRSLLWTGMDIENLVSAHINSADTASKCAGDVSFSIKSSRFAVEVKDRSLSRSEATASIDKARIADVTDLIFVIRSKSLTEASFGSEEFSQLAERQFNSGLNVSLEPFEDFSRMCLGLIGEGGRRQFLENVGASLSEQNAERSHKL